MLQDAQKTVDAHRPRPAKLTGREGVAGLLYVRSRASSDRYSFIRDFGKKPVDR